MERHIAAGRRRMWIRQAILRRDYLRETSMALEPLPFDQVEVDKTITPGALSPCPFCGGTRMLMNSGVNRKPASGGVLYQSRITCQSYGCCASVLYNARTREEAQQRVIKQWERRQHTAPSSPMLERIEQLEAQRNQLLAALEGLAEDVQGLIAESHGVAGMHLNGDVAPWHELEAGGMFERLTNLPAAFAAIAAVKGGAL
jgi:hypothetical protein